MPPLPASPAPAEPPALFEPAAPAELLAPPLLAALPATPTLPPGAGAEPALAPPIATAGCPPLFDFGSPELALLPQPAISQPATRHAECQRRARTTTARRFVTSGSVQANLDSLHCLPIRTDPRLPRRVSDRSALDPFDDLR